RLPLARFCGPVGLGAEEAEELGASGLERQVPLYGPVVLGEVPRGQIEDGLGLAEVDLLVRVAPVRVEEEAGLVRAGAVADAAGARQGEYGVETVLLGPAQVVRLAGQHGGARGDQDEDAHCG